MLEMPVVPTMTFSDVKTYLRERLDMGPSFAFALTYKNKECPLTMTLRLAGVGAGGVISIIAKSDSVQIAKKGA